VESDGALSGILRPSQVKICRAFVVLCAVLVFLSLSGCRRAKPGRLTPGQIHQITQELAKAAADKAPQGSVVKSRQARMRPPAARSEEIYVGLRGGAVRADQIEQMLAGIATGRGLTVDHEVAGSGITNIVLRAHGVITHRIEIEELATPAERSPVRPGQARLAILMDDLGSDRGAADAIFSLRVPITVSVLPFHAHSQEIAHKARQHGCEVMLHLPMQSLANESPEQQELRPGLSLDQVRSTVEKMLDAVPEADGVNNHQGSQATADAALMNELMHVLNDEGVFYVDSRTTAATVAFDAARREGVRTAFRNVPFLDDVQSKDAVKQQLQVAIQLAKQKGEAIAIGHPHAETLAALGELLPQAKKEGVQLVLVSELVR
jgi:polysaccharide deacetylase 2 family uncharacterized protein YibQ